MHVSNRYNITNQRKNAAKQKLGERYSESNGQIAF